MNYLFEIGCEELPSGAIQELSIKLKENFQEILENYNIKKTEIKLCNTPRRITLLVYKLPEKTPERIEIIKGPLDNLAEEVVNAFCKKNNVEIKDLIKVDNRFCIEKKIQSVNIKDILKEACIHAIKKLSGAKWMSWHIGEYNFSRPIRWIVSLLDSEIVDLEIFGVKANRESRINRLLEASNNGFKFVKVENFDSYKEIMRKNLVEVDREARTEMILSQIRNLENKNNIKVEVKFELLEEIVDLIEYPTVLIGSFEENFLDLPDFLIRTVLNKHQRYFSCLDKNNKLTNKFVFVANCLEKAQKQVIEGNEKVLKARLKDAEFFVQEDLKIPLENKKQFLKQMTFQKELGEKDSSTFAKAERLENICTKLGNKTQGSKLMKCDLASATVFEFPELQGLMGGFIAEKQGQSKEIAQAIAEQYMPIASDADLPQTPEGKIFALADKIDNLICLFSLNKIPSGSADPFALRRQAQGIVDILLSLDQNISIYDLCLIAFQELKKKASLNEFEEFFYKFGKVNLAEFFRQRLIHIISNRNHDKVLCEAFFENNDLKESPKKIQELVLHFEALKEESSEIITAIKRINRILKKKTPTKLNIDLFKVEAEKTLYKEFIDWKENNKEINIMNLTKLKTAINNFFDNVLIEDINDPINSENRVNLLFELLKSLNEKYLSPNWEKIY